MFHTVAYVYVQKLVAVNSHAHEFFTGLHVGHSPTPVERVEWWIKGPGSSTFAELYGPNFEYTTEEEKKKLDCIAAKARAKADLIIRQIGELGQIRA